MADITREVFQKHETIKRNTRRKVGIKLPLSDSNGRLFQSSYTTDEQAYSNLVNLILTQRGERINHVEFGTNILSTVFEQMSDGLAERISADINAAVGYWLPYLNVDVEVHPATVDDIHKGHLLSIIINYYINNRLANKPIIVYVTEVGTLITA